MSRRLRPTRLLGALLLSCVTSGASAETATPAELKELLLLSGTEATLRPLSAQLLAQARQLAEATAKARARSGGPADESHVKRLATAFDPERLLGIIAGIYGRHFTRQEVQDLLAFYRTPIGRKLAAHQPVLSQEMQEAAQAWVQEQMAVVSR